MLPLALIAAMLVSVAKRKAWIYYIGVFSVAQLRLWSVNGTKGKGVLQTDLPFEGHYKCLLALSMSLRSANAITIRYTSRGTEVKMTTFGLIFDLTVTRINRVPANSDST